MWCEEYTEYVLRHFRFYFEVPEDVNISHGGSGDIVVAGSGKSFFESIEREPFFRVYENLPVLFPGNEETALMQVGTLVRVNADLIAGIFFLLSGWEERVFPPEDDRLFSEATWQGRHGFESLALADYYFELLAKAVTLSCGKEIRRRKLFAPASGIFLSHDIDKLRSGRLEGSYNAIKTGKVKKGLSGIISMRDPWNNLLEIASLEDAFGLRSTFFMLTEKGKTEDGVNSDYDIDNKKLVEEMTYLQENGWEVGLHGSLGTHLSSEQINLEKKKMPLSTRGNRFHFLKFRHPKSFGELEKASLHYDCTLGFPDKPGFRNGTAHPFKPFDFERKKAFDLIEIPLHVMDTTLQHPKYLGFSPEHALPEIMSIYNEVKMHNGVLSLLWHNNYFSDFKYEGWREIYSAFLSEVTADAEFFTGSQIEEIYSKL